MKEDDKNKLRKGTHAYMKYSGLAFQMAAIVILAILGGQKLDSMFGFEKPWMTMLLTLFLFSAYLYKLYKELIK